MTRDVEMHSENENTEQLCSASDLVKNRLECEWRIVEGLRAVVHVISGRTLLVDDHLFETPWAAFSSVRYGTVDAYEYAALRNACETLGELWVWNRERSSNLSTFSELVKRCMVMYGDWPQEFEDAKCVYVDLIHAARARAAEAV